MRINLLVSNVPYTYTLLADILTILVIGLGVSLEKGGINPKDFKIIIFGCLAYLIVGPVLALIQHGWMSGLISFGLRLALPICLCGLAVFIINRIYESHGNVGDMGPPLLAAICGSASGMSLAIVILAWTGRR
jgi:hypothetical protein